MSKKTRKNKTRKKSRAKKADAPNTKTSRTDGDWKVLLVMPSPTGGHMGHTGGTHGDTWGQTERSRDLCYLVKPFDGRFPCVFENIEFLIRTRDSHLTRNKRLSIYHLTNIRFCVNLPSLSGAYASRARHQSDHSQNGTHSPAKKLKIA